LTCDSTSKNCVAVPTEYVCATANPIKGDALAKKFFSYVYQCEGGNGNSASEDGYKYRGHGAVQLTWKKTYQAFDTWLKTNYKDKYKDVVANPKVIDDDKELFILSAMWFWNTNNLNKLADDDNIKAITLKINSKGEGLKGRENYANQLKSSLK
jgi:Predicted chitinase